jgi:hypothetical protein
VVIDNGIVFPTSLNSCDHTRVFEIINHLHIVPRRQHWPNYKMHVYFTYMKATTGIESLATPCEGHKKWVYIVKLISRLYATSTDQTIDSDDFFRSSYNNSRDASVRTPLSLSLSLSLPSASLLQSARNRILRSNDGRRLRDVLAQNL